MDYIGNKRERSYEGYRERSSHDLKSYSSHFRDERRSYKTDSREETPTNFREKNYDFLIILTKNFYTYIDRNRNRLKGEVHF